MRVGGGVSRQREDILGSYAEIVVGAFAIENVLERSRDLVDGSKLSLKIFGHKSSPCRERVTRIGGNESYQPPPAP